MGDYESYLTYLANNFLKITEEEEENMNTVGKVIEKVFEEQADKIDKNLFTVYVEYEHGDRKTMTCKRVHLRTDLNILNVFTKDNEYKMIDLKFVTHFEIQKGGIK